jgi:hypothetical protein
VSQTHLGVGVSVSGFTPNVFNLTNHALTEMRVALDTVNNASLNRNVAGMKSSFADFSDEPIKIGFDDQRILLTPWTFSKREMFEAISAAKPTHADAKRAVEHARKGPFYVTNLVMGNYGAQDALKLHNNILTGIGATHDVTSGEVQRVSQVVMPRTAVEIRKKNPRDGDENHVTIVTILVGTSTVEKRVLLGIVGSIYSELVFSELRTLKELGYVVGGDVNEKSTVLTVGCYVQGNKKLPDEVEHDCENVMAVKVPEEVAALDDASFKSHREAFRSSLLEMPRTTSQQMEHFEDSILLGNCSNLISSMLSFLDTVNSKDQLLEAWKSAVMPTQGSKVAARKKVVVKYFGKGVQIPPVPNASHMRTLLASAGLNGTIAERMIKERTGTQVLPDANSTIRQSLVDAGGYFPTTVQCTWSPHNTTSTLLQKDASLSTIAEDKLMQEGSATSLPGMKVFMRSETRYAHIASHHDPVMESDLPTPSDDLEHTDPDRGVLSHRRHLKLRPRPALLRPRPVKLWSQSAGTRSFDLPGLQFRRSSTHSVREGLSFLMGQSFK